MGQAITATDDDKYMQRKKVVMLSNGIQEFKSMRDASEQTGLNISTISKHIKLNRKCVTTKEGIKIKFMLKNDYDKLSVEEINSILAELNNFKGVANSLFAIQCKLEDGVSVSELYNKGSETPLNKYHTDDYKELLAKIHLAGIKSGACLDVLANKLICEDENILYNCLNICDKLEGKLITEICEYLKENDYKPIAKYFVDINGDIKLK